MRRHSQRGFTLLEVMMALATLAIALSITIGAVVSNLDDARRAKDLGIAVELARGKMYDIEEMLLQDGFQELDQTEDGDFGDEGWKRYKWEYKVEKIELPGLGALQAAEGAEGEVAGDDSGSAGLGLGGGQDSSGMAGFGLVASQFEMISNVLERSIRRVTLTVTWKSGDWDEKTVVVCYFTNPQGVNEALAGAPPPGEEGENPPPNNEPPRPE